MIVEQADRDRRFEVSHDPFSIAGKAALIGGGLYAIDQTNFSGINAFSQRNNKFKLNLASMISNSVNTSRPKNAFSVFRSKYASNSIIEQNKNTVYAQNIDEITGKLSGGFRGMSGDFGNELKQVYNQIVHKEGIPTISYTMRNNEIAQINFRTKNANIPFSPVSKSGSVYAGKNLNSSFISRQVYHHTAAGTRFYGEDTGMARAVNRNLDSLLSGEMSPNYLKRAFDSARFYNDSEEMLNLNSNPMLVDLVRKSKIEDPSLKLNSMHMRPEIKNQFMGHMAAKNMAVSGPSDIAKGILHDLDSPLHQVPFLTDAPDPKKAIRDTLIRNADGSVGHNANRKVLFANEGFLKHFKDVLAENGTHIGELAADQAIFNADSMGTLIDTSRRISVGTNSMTESSEALLDKLAAASGKTPEQISKIFEDGGDLSSFPSEVQSAMKSTKLGDFRSGLVEERRRIQNEYDSASKAAKQAGLEVDSIDNKYFDELHKINKRIDESSYFGKSIDGVRDVNIEREMEGLFVNNISMEDGQLKVGLRREEAIGAGVKIHGVSGETKVVGKDAVTGFAAAAEEAYRRNGGVVNPEMKKLFGSIDMIEPADAVKDSLQERTAASTLYSARMKAQEEGNTQLVEALNKYNSDYTKLNEVQKKSVFDTVQSLTGKSIDQYVNGGIDGIGVVKNMEIALGKTAADMGSGGLAFVSRRHLENISAMGGDSFVKDVLSRRTNPDAVRAAEEFYQTLTDMGTRKPKNLISVKDLTSEDLGELFPNIDGEDASTILERRAARLGQLGVDGDAVIDLGMEVGGQSRVAVLSNKSYQGIIGAKIGGGAGDYTQFSEYDEAVRRVLYEAKSRMPDQKRLAIAMNNLQNATEMTKGTLTNNYTKDKIRQGIYGLVTSAPDGMHEYTRHLSQGVKNALPNFAVVSDSDFRNMFGDQKWNDVQDFIKQNGPYTRNTQFTAANTFKPNAFAMATREPVENALNHRATAVFPSSMFNSNVRDGQVSVLTERRKDGWTKGFMDFLYGDTDGDQLSLIAATTEESENYVKRLQSGNDAVSALYRDGQLVKGDLKLKGKAKYGVNPDGTERTFLEVSELERREAQLAQKLSEKANIGILSKGLEPAHNAARSMASTGADIASQARFQNTENALGFISEFTLKGKYQTLQNLKEGRSMELLEAVTGRGAFARSSVAERSAASLGMLDEMILGDGNQFLADQIRQNGNTVEVQEALRKAGHSADVAEMSYFRSFGNQKTMGEIIEAVDMGNKMGDTAEQIVQYASEGVGSDAFNKAARRESITALADNVKNVGFQGGKNLLKYALAPAAAIGFIGTLAGSKGEIRSVGQENYSDGQKKHFTSNHTPKPVIQPQMKRPKYENVQIRGESNQRQFNPNNVPNNSNVRLEDNQRTLNKYEIQDMVERGI